MMKLVAALLMTTSLCSAQTTSTITGFVRNAQTKEVLPFATVGVTRKIEQTISKMDGSFELRIPSHYIGDTLYVSYLGYKPLLKRIAELPAEEEILLQESYTLLEEVVIARTQIDVRKIDRSLRIIRGNLYAMAYELTNADYNLFLASLDEQGNNAQRRKFDYDLSQYDKATQVFFQRYVNLRRNEQVKDSLVTLNVGPHAWNDYPAVNITYEAAQQYCEWLTAQYNNYSRKKKFKMVKFRLPTLQEWQVAALGYDKFQTWELEKNMVEVYVPKDSLIITPKKGIKKMIPVGNDILYPWYGSFYYRRSPTNHMGCFLGNFRIDFMESRCKAKLPAYDGWSMMGRTASYFPNNIGLFDVVGNVAEMVQEKGRACGGSWDDAPEQCTIHSVKSYSRPDATIGFRVFMEVLEP